MHIYGTVDSFFVLRWHRSSAYCQVIADFDAVVVADAADAADNDAADADADDSFVPGLK